MKVYKQEEEFKPVYIVLENQTEVDVLYSIFNYSPLLHAFDTNHKGAAYAINKLYQNLIKYHGPDSDKFFRIIDKALE